MRGQRGGLASAKLIQAMKATRGIGFMQQHRQKKAEGETGMEGMSCIVASSAGLFRWQATQKRQISQTGLKAPFLHDL